MKRSNWIVLGCEIGSANYNDTEPWVLTLYGFQPAIGIPLMPGKIIIDLYTGLCSVYKGDELIQCLHLFEVLKDATVIPPNDLPYLGEEEVS